MDRAPVVPAHDPRRDVSAGLVAHRRRRPAFVDRLGGIGRDLQIRAVVVRIAAWLVVAVIGHELNHLQCALGAGEIKPGTVVIFRYQGPKGAPGMPEVRSLFPTIFEQH